MTIAVAVAITKAVAVVARNATAVDKIRHGISRPVGWQRTRHRGCHRSRCRRLRRLIDWTIEETNGAATVEFQRACHERKIAWCGSHSRIETKLRRDIRVEQRGVVDNAHANNRANTTINSHRRDEPVAVSKSIAISISERATHDIAQRARLELVGWPTEITQMKEVRHRVGGAILIHIIEEPSVAPRDELRRVRNWIWKHARKPLLVWKR